MDRIQVCVVVRPCVQAIDYADGHVPGVYVIEMNDMVPTDSLANAAKDVFGAIVPIRSGHRPHSWR